jgi:hypothetical protein
MGKRQEVVLTWLKFEKLFIDIFAQLSSPPTKLREIQKTRQYLQL